MESEALTFSEVYLRANPPPLRGAVAPGEGIMLVCVIQPL